MLAQQREDDLADAVGDPKHHAPAALPGSDDLPGAEIDFRPAQRDAFRLPQPGGAHKVEERSVVGAQEARAISERTKAAMQAAKARGKKLGGPKLAEARLLGHAANRKAADKFAANVRPIVEQIRASGATSLRDIASALTARGVPTARGGAWSAAQVANLMQR